MPLVVQIGLLFLAQAANNPDSATLTAPVTSSPCPPGQSQADIIVCGRPNDGSRYRLPAPDRFDPAGPVDSVSRAAHRMLDVGATGIQSCSTVGPGGWTGCEFIDWRHADEQYAGRNHTILPRASLHVGVVNGTPPR